MAQNRLPIIAGIIAVLAFLLYSATFIVSERQQAIVLRFGQIVAVKTEPGIYFKLPFGFLDADTVQMIDDRLLRFDLDDIRVQVSGGKFYDVDAFLVYRITDARKFRETFRAARSLPNSVCAPVSMQRCVVSTVSAVLKPLFRKSVAT